MILDGSIKIAKEGKKEEIIKIWLINCIKEDLKVEISDDGYDENLFGYPYMIAPRDLLYIIIKLENYLGYKITDIFKSSDSNIMTIKNLSHAILKVNNN